MYWVKDKGGNLVNLALAVAVYCRPPEGEVNGKWELVADLQSVELVLMMGKREECGSYRDSLLLALKERENARNQVDVLLERT